MINEISIGNLFRDKESGRLFFWDVDNYNEIFTDNFEPVEITDNILIKYGFLPDRNGSDKKYCRWSIKGSSCLIQHTGFNGAPYYMTKRGDHTIRHLKYVHELQNMLFWIDRFNLIIEID
jgi:hypothetical protein